MIFDDRDPAFDVPRPPAPPAFVEMIAGIQRRWLADRAAEDAAFFDALEQPGAIDAIMQKGA